MNLFLELLIQNRKFIYFLRGQFFVGKIQFTLFASFFPIKESLCGSGSFAPSFLIKENLSIAEVIEVIAFT